MEYRYYLTTAAVVLVLQLLIYSFSRTLGWLFNLSAKARKIVHIFSYLSLNLLIILHITRVFTAFRLIAFVLALLLFAFFISFFTACFYRFVRQNATLSKGLKITYPFAFIGLVLFSVYNAYTPKVVRYQITLDKPLASIRIGVASDLHLGGLFGTQQLEHLANIFQEEQVDLILLPGDIMDDNLLAFRQEQMGPSLAKLKAPLGVYATLGNHDFFGSQDVIAAEIKKAGIHVLWDQAVEINGKFTIIGRNDDLAKNRPTTKQLLKSVNPAQPVLLMDHRPTDIEAHSRLPIDIQVSGHTHHGQIFPANLITGLMYRLDYGYEKIGLGHYIVTSGYGFWGIPMRLGTQSEVVIIEAKGTSN